MKKLIALFIITLGFSVTAVAQQKVTVKSTTSSSQPSGPKTKATEAAANKDVAALNGAVALTDIEKKNFFNLFEYKHRALIQNPDAESKKTLAQTIEAKIRASLTPDQLAKLDGNKKLLQTLTH